MPRPSKGPRLYLRRDGDKRVWIIRDNGQDTRTGYEEHQILHAEKALVEYVARRAEGPEKLPMGAGFIYFITSMSSTNYPIKIGWSATAPRRRLDMLQVGNPNLLVVAATLVGTRVDESRLHLYFAELHIRGEWFRRGDELLDYIGGLPGQTEVYGVEEFAPAFLSAQKRTAFNRTEPLSP